MFWSGQSGGRLEQELEEIRDCYVELSLFQSISVPRHRPESLYPVAALRIHLAAVSRRFGFLRLIWLGGESCRTDSVRLDWV